MVQACFLIFSRVKFKYYLLCKAYATNSSGTVFGAEVTFTTGQVSNYKSIKDIEGNNYNIINIGDQIWMQKI